MKSDLCRVFEKWEKNDDYLDTIINAGIEKNRKGDVTIRVKDKDGKVVMEWPEFDADSPIWVAVP